MTQFLNQVGCSKLSFGVKCEAGPWRGGIEELAFARARLLPGSASLKSERIWLLDAEPAVCQWHFLALDVFDPAMLVPGRDPVGLGEYTWE